jgi:hypothetical protein
MNQIHLQDARRGNGWRYVSQDDGKFTAGYPLALPKSNRSGEYSSSPLKSLSQRSAMKVLDWRCPICAARWTLPQPTAKPLQVVVDLIVKHIEEHRKYSSAPVLIPTERAADG